MCVEEEKAVEKEWGGVFLLLLFYQVKYFKIIKCCIHSRGKFSPDSLQKNSKSCILELAPLVLMMLGCLLIGEAQPTPSSIWVLKVFTPSRCLFRIPLPHGCVDYGSNSKIIATWVTLSFRSSLHQISSKIPNALCLSLGQLESRVYS